MKTEYAILDYHKALINFENDRALYAAALERFTAEVKRGIDTFKALAETKDMDSIFREAHKIKGAACLLGAEALYQLALRLEKAGSTGVSGQIEKLVNTYEETAASFLREAEDYRSEDKI